MYVTNAMRAFGLGYFRDSTSILELRDIGARPKGTPFGLSYHPRP